ncbi:hypothetical protein BGW38_008112, partial [Lunasporangiospora selenospora]
VGATQDVPESGAGLSGGGFSNYFERPSYQQDAVEKYLTSIGDMYNGRFSASKRAYPDVSAQGEKIIDIWKGKEESIAGTSASAPIFASVVALINERLIAEDRPPLGFLNPLIYSDSTIWNDITMGSNPGCNTPGFPAKEGWDPVTGMGTPDFVNFAAAVGVSDS